jgi:hypothetical protein
VRTEPRSERTLAINRSDPIFQEAKRLVEEAIKKVVRPLQQKVDQLQREVDDLKRRREKDG